MNKFYRSKFKIQTAYDAEGKFDAGWRSLQKQIDRERVVEEFEPKDKKRQKTADDEQGIGQFFDSANKHK